MWNECLALVLFLPLALGCRHENVSKGKSVSPRYWVPHQEIEYKLNLLNPELEPIDVAGFEYIRMGKGNDVISFWIYGDRHSYCLRYNIQDHQWSSPLAFHDPRPPRENEEREAHRLEDSKAYALAKDRFLEEEKQLREMSKPYEVEVFLGFPPTWVSLDPDSTPFCPPEAALFEYRTEGKYRSEWQKGGGGPYWGERKTWKEYKTFIGLKTMFFKSKPVFQVDEEQMDIRTYVLGDFRTVIYFWRSNDSIRFDILDLWEYWDKRGEN